MFGFPVFAQLPLGFGLGLASCVFPGLLRPFVVVALLLLGFEAMMLYRAGGADALETALAWLMLVVRNAALLLAGLGVGRWSGEIVFGRL